MCAISLLLGNSATVHVGVDGLVGLSLVAEMGCTLRAFVGALTGECPFQACLFVSLFGDGFRGAGSHLGDLVEVCGFVAINDGAVGSEVDGLVQGICCLCFLGSFEFRLPRREVLLPCVRDVR